MELLKTILSIIISLSTVFGIFTAIINKLFNNKLKPIEDKIERNRLDSIQEDMRMARYHVVKFASELRSGVKNNFFTAEEEYIKECYHQLCMDESKRK